MFLWGGHTESDAVKWARNKLLGLAAKAGVNWEGRARKGERKHSLKDSPVTAAVFSKFYYQLKKIR